MLKDYFASDMKVFFNVGEFSAEHLIDGVSKTITVDNERIKEVSKATNQGIPLGEILYTIPVNEYGDKAPKIGDSQRFDKRLLYISSVSEDLGVYEIILTQNLGE